MKNMLLNLVLVVLFVLSLVLGTMVVIFTLDRMGGLAWTTKYDIMLDRTGKIEATFPYHRHDGIRGELIYDFELEKKINKWQIKGELRD